MHRTVNHHLVRAASLHHDVAGAGGHIKIHRAVHLQRAIEVTFRARMQ